MIKSILLVAVVAGLASATTLRAQNPAGVTPPAPPAAGGVLQPPGPPPKDPPPGLATQSPPPPPSAQPLQQPPPNAQQDQPSPPPNVQQRQPPMAATAPRPPAPTQVPPAGQWVHTSQYGWLWMPYERSYTYVVPDAALAYMFVYYPVFGWRWVVAPWVLGFGMAPYWGVAGPLHFGWYVRPWFRVGVPYRGPGWGRHPVRGPAIRSGPHGRH